MCGIFGVIGATPLDPVVGRVIDLLRHRGPDDAGFVQVSSGVLAHTRLSIIDLSPLGHQPMCNHNRNVWITYNGEIYNYRELRSELSGYPFRSHTDTEVILAAYERWGEAFVTHLRGMFAFGLWDERNQTLLCATDRFSIKNLYYTQRDGAFLFSSEVKPLAACGVRLQPDDRMLYQYLAYGLLDHDERTLFQGIYQLRPATLLRYRDGQIHQDRYWDLSPAENDDEPMDTNGLSTVREEIEESIQFHLRGDVEVALSHSSGLDSHVLRLLVNALDLPRGGARRCFTYCFPGTPYDEGARARPLLQGDTRWTHYKTNVVLEDLLECVSRVVIDAEEPLPSVATYGYWLNARRAREEGIKVLLDGQGADEVFAGYRYYYELQLGKLARKVNGDMLRAELAAFNRVHGANLEYPSPEFDELTSQNGPAPIRSSDGTAMSSDYLAPDFSRRYAADPPQFPLRFDCPVRQARYLDLFYLKIPKLLRFQDKCAMASSVEVRVPFLDHVLVERLFSLPARVLLHDGLTKAPLRKIAQQLSPDAQPEPSKLYVSTPQREWIKGPLRSCLRALMADSELTRAGYVDSRRLLSQFDDYCVSAELGNSFFAWKFVMLEMWYRAFVCGEWAPA